MARKIIWTFGAADDLEATATYIARDSGFYARSFVREIRDASLSLKEFPERGRMVPEFSNTAVRELFIKEYRLIYKIKESRIVVLGIIHGKRDLKALSENGEWKN
ncbi:MAG: type II toxin-antitoxin system RelE/ParE family toxin [Deltaproteobacteria bacterium]|nr:type II toxin-antitoxin system RelE/ParE family toxin [Deltaproteobacteria bacterium]